LSSASSDLSALFYGVSGLKLLADKITDSQKICDLARKQLKDNDLESLYFSSGLQANLDGCNFGLSKAQDLITASIADGKTTQELFYAASSGKHLKLNVDSAKLAAALAAAIKKDDSASSLGFAFHTATLLVETPLDPFFSRIEDCVAQADEIDGKYLKFEGVVCVTSSAVSGIYKLAEQMKKAPSLKPDELIKLTNFLLSRKGVQFARSAYNLLSALKILSSNQFHVPLALSLATPIAVSSTHPTVRVRINDVMGKSVGALTVTVDKAVHLPTKGVVINKKPMTAVAGDNSLYEFNFMESKRDSGFYSLTISAASATEKKFLGGQGAELSVKVSTDIVVENTEIAVVDRDQTDMGGNIKKVPTFSKLGTILEADVHQKLIMKFLVKDKTTNEPTKVHQAFVVFTHLKSGQEIIFIAETDSAKAYKFDVDLQKSAKDFEYLNGKYSMKLILGDAVVNNAIDWHVADINLKFPEHEKPERSTFDQIFYEKRPEIAHTFRVPEKRPNQVVSDTFTILVLAPLVLALLLWLRIGANLSNFPFSLSALAFHVGLAAIFGLYFVFWVKLNMFQTLKYLSIIGTLTFLAGNRMLRAMAERRKGKTE
jgi:oligosaccharyltransferase complex subunit delta (ribophorin II)